MVHGMSSARNWQSKGTWKNDRRGDAEDGEEKKGRVACVLNVCFVDLPLALQLLQGLLTPAAVLLTANFVVRGSL